MRLNRNTLIFLAGSLLVIVAALALINRPTTAPGTEDGDDTVETFNSEIFPDLTADAITLLTVRDNVLDQTLTLTRQEDDLWAMADANGAITGDGDQIVINRAISNFATLRADDRFAIDDETGGLAAFGLDNPTHTLTAQTTDETYTVQVGNQTPGGNRFYALVGDDGLVYQLAGVTTVNSLTTLSFQPPVVPTATPTPQPQLMIPGLIYPAFNTEAINRFAIRNTTSGAEVVFTRPQATDTDTPWQLTQSPADDTDNRVLDEQRMRAAIEIFGTIQAFDAIDDADLTNLGLDDPAYALQADSATRTYRLQVGNADLTGTRYYALVDDFDRVVVVDKDAVDILIELIGTPPLMPVPEATPEMTPEVTPESGG